jgi:protoporphyrinogen oxidase
VNGVAILGSGMAACGASHRLLAEGVASTMYDQGSMAGGHTKTFEFPGGWVFDDGPHVSFTEDPRIQDLFAENIGGKFQKVSNYVNNFWQGYWIKHPAQCNLYGLPTQVVVDCIKDFMDAQSRPAEPVANYAEWLLTAFGRTFAETFPIEYAKKVHTTPAANLTTEWLGPRLYRPSLDEVLAGALSAQTPNVHYIDHFRYPTEGGFISYLRPFHQRANLRLGHRVVGIDAAQKVVTFESGDRAGYRHLISSIPLPDLIPMIAGAPLDVLAAARRLAATTIVMVNVGVDRVDLTDATWSYFYDQDFIITRTSAPHLMSPRLVPPGCGSIQCEIYFSEKYKPLTLAPQDLIEPAINDLRRCGLIRESDRVVHKSAHVSPYGNVIWDHDRAPALEIVHGYLDSLGIRYCGRFGDWAYLWTDGAFKSGENAAERVLGGD